MNTASTEYKTAAKIAALNDAARSEVMRLTIWRREGLCHSMKLLLVTFL